MKLRVFWRPRPLWSSLLAQLVLRPSPLAAPRRVPLAGPPPGAAVGGPVGAAVGGVTGAIVGGALAPADFDPREEYVVREHRPSVKVQEDVAVGAALPSSVQLYPVPADTGVRTQYRYTVVNDHTVLVDPGTRKVIQVIE